MGKKSLDTTDMIESSDDFETAYEAYAQGIYRFLFWRTKNTAVSEDLKSRVFEKAWRSRDSFQGGSVKAWLYRIARNVLIDHWRKKQDILVADTDLLPEEASSDNDNIDEKLDTEATVRELRKAITKLPKDMRSVITLRFIEGLSCREVALYLHLSESNVRVLQYRALQKLRGYLQ
jgi:RNA polymerase sigma-70 factor (ECF subfamily)